MQQLLQKYPLLKKGEPIYKNCMDYYEKNTKNCLIGLVIILMIISFYIGKEIQMRQLIYDNQKAQDILYGRHVDSQNTIMILEGGNVLQNTGNWIEATH